MPAMPAAAKVAFIGFDAADGDLLAGWAADGTLPSFRRLLGEAAWTPTRNPPGLYVGAVWPSFYTGLSPARHARYCHTQLRPGTYETAVTRPKDVRGAPFWEALSRAGRRVAVIDVPKSSLSRELNGIQIVDWMAHDPDRDGLCTSPRELAAELKRRFGVDPVGNCNGDRTTAAAFAELRDALVGRAARKAALCEDLLAQGPWDAFVTVFAESHCVGHQCWHLHDPKHPRHDAALAHAVGDPIRDVYVALDAALGRLLARLSDETTVLVLASHGIGPHYDGTFLLHQLLQRLPRAGAQLERPGLVRALRAVVHRLPRGLYRRLSPLGGPARSRLGVKERDLSRDACFQVPNNDVYGALRINLVGREPKGRIHPGPEYEAFCAALIRDLLTFTNLDSGEPLVRRVLHTRDLYPGEPQGELPDLLIEWNREAPIFRIHSPLTGTIRATYRGRRTGDHRAAGLLFARGPGIRPGRLEGEAAVEDLAPTIAGLLGVELPACSGHPLALGADARAKAASQ
jgi:predicted AlkP superfamily phosphohydrolase/phosphomutase